MIKKELLEFLYESAHIQRWNDHMRPKGGFTELDKQAHKMIIAYVLAKYEIEDRKAPVSWRLLIEGGIFEFLHRVRVTDIKPPVFHELMARHGAELNRWVLDKLADRVDSLAGDFAVNFTRYLTEPGYAAAEKKILRAAHYLATDWEFQMIYQLNSHIYGVEETRTRIANELEEHFDLVGVQKIGLGRKTRHFIDLVGQLRFQQRWAQSPRVPETSVMGHMLIVAMLAYFGSLEVGACEARLVNNYFAGLFHDLPEVLTRDIISPVKSSVAGLDNLIKEIEARQVAQKLYPLLPDGWHQEIRYYMEDEFANKVLMDGRAEKVAAGEIGARYNEDRFSPIDGEMIKACDHLAAYIEASLSIAHGITSQPLRDGVKALYAQYEGRRQVAGVDFGSLFDYFRTK
jgi:putative hydrolase of HD superfamily